MNDSEFVTLPHFNKEYKINKQGVVVSPHGRILTEAWHKGYLIIQLYSHYENGRSICKNIPLHRLLAIAFIPNPNNYPIVNHIDGDKLNNSIENLEWCTNLENIQHAWKIGLFQNIGETHGSARLTNEQVLAIRAKGKYTSYAKIGLANGISYSMARCILKRERWKHI